MPRNEHSKYEVSDPGGILNKCFRFIGYDYSPRHLTLPSDKLPAVAGVAAIFQATLPGARRYLAGLWSGNVVPCLAWEISEFDSPRIRNLTSLEQYTFRAPTWSWAAQDLNISWYSAHTLPTPFRPKVDHMPPDPYLVEEKIVPVAGDDPSYLLSAKRGSYVVLEGSCIPASDRSRLV